MNIFWKGDCLPNWTIYNQNDNIPGHGMLIRYISKTSLQFWHDRFRITANISIYITLSHYNFEYFITLSGSLSIQKNCYSSKKVEHPFLKNTNTGKTIRIRSRNTYRFTSKDSDIYHFRTWITSKYWVVEINWSSIKKVEHKYISALARSTRLSSRT